ncbi:TIGR03089 family protein [Cellulomonas denverensis]|uniref:TIGR03089 family protein n=1 Tax=Cellulomonas denverensis TaxID=264297 RepID=UPI0035EC895E
MATTVSTLLAGLHRDPGRPRLTWYGPQGERIELSGAVLDNWVTKTVNLMVEEFDTGPGSVVSIALPPHWRTVVWALAAWRCGAAVSDDPIPDVRITDRPDQAGPAVDLVAVALPALALRWPGPPLAAGVIDAAQAVMTYGDQIGWAPDPAAATPPCPV